MTLPRISESKWLLMLMELCEMAPLLCRRLLRVEAAHRVAADRAGGSEAGHVPQPDLRPPQPRCSFRRWPYLCFYDGPRTRHGGTILTNAGGYNLDRI